MTSDYLKSQRESTEKAGEKGMGNKKVLSPCASQITMKSYFSIIGLPFFLSLVALLSTAAFLLFLPCCFHNFLLFVHFKSKEFASQPKLSDVSKRGLIETKNNVKYPSTLRVQRSHHSQILICIWGEIRKQESSDIISYFHVDSVFALWRKMIRRRLLLNSNLA